MPLAPAVALRSLDVHSIMIAGDVGQRLQTQRAGVVLVRAPGGELDIGDDVKHLRIVAEGELASIRH